MAIDLLWGDSHAGKSTAAEQLMWHYIHLTGKKGRVYIGDGGVEAYNRRGLVDDGMIEIMDYSMRPHPMVILNMISELYFPVDPADPNSALAKPAQNIADLLCMVVYEGGTVMGQYMMDGPLGSMAWQNAHGTNFGGRKGDKLEEVQYEADTPYNEYNLQGLTSGLDAYRVQQKLLKAIKASHVFPGMVLWTAHPTTGADKAEGGSINQYGQVAGKSVIGPDFGGKAMVSLISKEFGNTLHVDTVWTPVTKKDKVTTKDVVQLERAFRLYTTRHRDPEGKVATEYIAGHRYGKGMPEYFTSAEEGDSIIQFYSKANELVAARRAVKQVKQESA